MSAQRDIVFRRIILGLPLNTSSREMRMDSHQAYCLNFIALTQRWGRGSIAVCAAWVLSVLAITLTVVAAWLIGRLLAIGPVPIDLKELFQIEL